MHIKKYQVIVVGGGASGMMAAITAAEDGKSVLLLEKLSSVGSKLKATGGGRCNLTNTLSNDDFMGSFGKNGRFLTTAIQVFDHNNLVAFFKTIGVESHAPDGFRVFPITHNSSTVIDAMKSHMHKLDIEIVCSQRVISIKHNTKIVIGVETKDTTYKCDAVIIATGGMGYLKLGAEGDGYEFATSLGHSLTTIYPAMMPLKVKEKWVDRCRADTIPKVHMKIDIKKYKNISAKGDLIFTKDGIRGPVVLDFSREITPLLDKFGEVPILVNLTKGMNRDQISKHIKLELIDNPHINMLNLLETLLPTSLSKEFCTMSGVDMNLRWNKVDGTTREEILSLLTWLPLTIVGHNGFKSAMITRGGVKLNEIDPYTMGSKKINNLYFCGEIVDIDGPCGGYNLQWAFSSGYLSGKLL